MIYFANNPIPHIINASTTAKAIVKIYDGTTLLNEKSLLLSYPIGGKYNFDLSCFFKFYKALQFPVPTLENPVEYLGNAKTFTVKTYVDNVLIDTRTYDIVAGSSDYSFSRYKNQFLTNLPNTVEIQADEPVFRYLYLSVQNLTKFFIEAEFTTDTNEVFSIQELPINYQQGLYCFDFSLSRFQKYTVGKIIVAYKVSIKHKNAVYLNTTINITMDRRPSYHPIQLLYRNQLGVFETYRFYTSAISSEMNYSKSSLDGNQELNTYAENRSKLKLSAKPMRQSEIDAIVYSLSNSLEIYHWQNGKLKRLIQSTTSYQKFDVTQVLPSLQLEFQYAKVTENYV